MESTLFRQGDDRCDSRDADGDIGFTVALVDIFFRIFFFFPIVLVLLVVLVFLVIFVVIVVLIFEVLTIEVVIVLFPLLIVRSRFCSLGSQGSAADGYRRNSQY